MFADARSLCGLPRCYLCDVTSCIILPPFISERAMQVNRAYRRNVNIYRHVVCILNTQGGIGRNFEADGGDVFRMSECGCGCMNARVRSRGPYRVPLDDITIMFTLTLMYFGKKIQIDNCSLLA